MYFLADFSQNPTERKRRERDKKNKEWNNWEKTREIRSGVSTGQRVSQDVRGWLNFAKKFGGM